jgi:hypothetical protein
MSHEKRPLVCSSIRRLKRDRAMEQTKIDRTGKASEDRRRGFA